MLDNKLEKHRIPEEWDQLIERHCEGDISATLEVLRRLPQYIEIAKKLGRNMATIPTVLDVLTTMYIKN